MVALKILEAAEIGDISALERFQNEVTEELSDDQGANCMHYAARQNGCDILNFLVKRRGFSGKKRSNIGSTPAHDAAAAGNLEAVQWLLQNTGCEVNDQDGTGATMLHLACRFRHTHVTEWLVEEGHCDVMLRTASGGLALHFAVVGGDFEAVKILMDAEPRSVNYQTGNGATAVYLACQEGQYDILEFLIRMRRGNAIIKAYDGMSCLHAAAQSGHLDCVQFLVQEENCNPNERDFDGATPLHYAASRGQYKVIDWLLREGRAKITLDNIGGSPLHNAAETGQIRCIKILLDNGCSPDITDNNGLTAAELARKCRHDSCADLIQSYVSQDLQDPDYDYLQQVQSPRPQIIHHYLSNYNGVPEPQRTVSPSGAPLNIADSRARSPDSRSRSPTFTPSATPNTSESPRKFLDPEPDYSTDLRNQKNSENIFQATKSPSRRLVDYLKEPVLDLNSQPEPDNYPVPEYKDSSVEKLQPEDVLVRPPSPDIDYSFRGRSSPTYDRIGAVTNSRESIASHLSAHADSTEFLDGNRRSVNDLDLLDKPPSLSSSVSSLSDHSHLDDLIAFTTGVLKGQGKIYNKLSEGEPLIYESDQKVNKKGKTHPPKPSRAFQKANSVPLIKVSEVKGDYQHLGYNGHEKTRNPNYVNVPLDTTTLDVDKKMDRPPSEYLYRDVVIEERDEKDDSKARRDSKDEIKTESVDSIIENGCVAINGDLNGNDHKIKIEVDSASKTQDCKETVTTQASVPAPPPLPSIKAPSEIVTNGHNAAPQPPPPPPPPAIPSQVAPANNSRAPASSQLVNGVTPIPPPASDVKQRPVSLFNQEDIASKRNSLNRTPQRPSSVTSPMANSNFIEELKLATKSSTLRRTSNAGIGPGEPQGAKMVFSSTNGPVMNGMDKSKGQENGPSKVDLTGEFDPKNFVDQVPNKDNLPSWKVQLLARQIAEKSMKETLENRKKEAEENRFKNMPAWKRALVEKKEAEARAAEEKKQQQEAEQKVVSSKRVPTVSVLAKSEGASLAPWQRELQGK